ncbi:hypothetical protein, partial [Serratia fonticola]
AVTTTTDVVQTPGQVVPYQIQPGNAGEVLELSVQARNGASKSGNTVTVDTSMDNAAGNEANGGGQGGSIVDPTVQPEIRNLAIKGNLAIGTKISGSYQFDAKTGYPGDASLYAWSAPGQGAGSTAIAVVNTTDQITDQGVVPERDVTLADSGKVIELSVLPRNSNNVRGTVSTIKTNIKVGMTLMMVPETADYRDNFKYVTDITGQKMKGLIWPYDPSQGQYAVGAYRFYNVSPFKTRTRTGLIRFIADDTLESIQVNGVSYTVPLSGCKWDKNFCEITVNNFTPGGDNTVSIVANNEGFPGESNPGALNVIVIDTINGSGGTTVLDTTDASKWNFEIK